MFPRIKRAGRYSYLQLVETCREEGKVRQKVLLTFGRLDRLKKSGQLDRLVIALAHFSEKIAVLVANTPEQEIEAEGIKIGPSLIFERIWRNTRIPDILNAMLKGRKYEFEVERVIFMTVVHRLFGSGSDRSAEKWCGDYKIEGTDNLRLHHLYRGMAWLGEVLPKEEQDGATPFSPRCVKDLIEEEMFLMERDLFSELNLVFFDTTSIYFEGAGGDSLGEYGFSKDKRPDLKQMVVGVVLDEQGNPICCELWPGNTADVKTLIPVIERLRGRFSIGRICIVADRGMISKNTLKYLEDPDNKLDYILGVRMHKMKEVNSKVLTQAGRYQIVNPFKEKAKDPSPLKVKEVKIDGKRYIICHNEEQAKKDEHDRESILEGLRKKLSQGAKSLIGNKGYRKYLKTEGKIFKIDEEKVKKEKKYDGKWVLRTNTNISSDTVALKYKELLMVEQVFRNMKSLLETRPIYHKRDETIRGHVFCSFLALRLLKELVRLLEKSGYQFEWEDVKRDLEALIEFHVESNGKKFTIRSTCKGTCGNVCKSVGVSLPPTIRMNK
jgi:transposase